MNIEAFLFFFRNSNSGLHHQKRRILLSALIAVGIALAAGCSPSDSKGLDSPPAEIVISTPQSTEVQAPISHPIEFQTPTPTPAVADTPISHPSEVCTPTPQSEYCSSFQLVEIRKVLINGERVNLTICFSLPSPNPSWVLVRVPGDVSLSDGQHVIPLNSFSFVSFEDRSDPACKMRCDEFKSSLPEDFKIDEAILTVKRIAADFPAKIDWDAVLQELERVAPDLVIEPDRDQPGPGFGVIEMPPGMTNHEAVYLVVGLIEPVVIGPWSIPIQVDTN